MPEKAKKLLDKATPGVEKIESVEDLYGRLVKHTMEASGFLFDETKSRKAQYNYSSNKLSEAYSSLVRLDNMDAISHEAFRSLGGTLSDIQTDIENEVSKRAIYNSIKSLAGEVTTKLSLDLARYCRAPNAVGIGRTVSE